MPVQHVCFRRIGNLSDAAVPQDIAVGRIERNQVPRVIALEQQPSGCRQTGAR